jgi:hypothetical protein
MVARGLGTRPAVWIGDLSYSWYLWHWPLIVFARALWPDWSHVAVAAAAVSLLPAWLSYRYVENPIRVDPRVRGKLVIALGAACVAVAGTASAGLALAPRGLAASSEVRSWQRMERFHADYLRGCSDSAPLGAHPRCSGAFAEPRRGRLIGDSNAGQFTEPFVRAAKVHGDGLGRHLLQLPVRRPAVSARTAATPRAGRSTTLAAELLRRRPRLVVIAARTDHYLDDPQSACSRPGPGGLPSAAKAQLWRESRAVPTPPRRAGIPTLVVHPVPALAIGRAHAQSCAS